MTNFRNHKCVCTKVYILLGTRNTENGAGLQIFQFFSIIGLPTLSPTCLYQRISWTPSSIISLYSCIVTVAHTCTVWKDIKWEVGIQHQCSLIETQKWMRRWRDPASRWHLQVRRYPEITAEWTLLVTLDCVQHVRSQPRLLTDSRSYPCLPVKAEDDAFKDMSAFTCVLWTESLFPRGKVTD